jgi:hypothetical protein
MQIHSRQLALSIAVTSVVMTTACGQFHFSDMPKLRLSVSAPDPIAPDSVGLALLYEPEHSSCTTLPSETAATQNGEPMVNADLGQVHGWPLPSCAVPRFNGPLPTSEEQTTVFEISTGNDRLVAEFDHLTTPLTLHFIEPADGIMHPGQRVTVGYFPPRRVKADGSLLFFGTAPAMFSISKDRLTIDDAASTISFVVPSNARPATLPLAVHLITSGVCRVGEPFKCDVFVKGDASVTATVAVP